MVAEFVDLDFEEEAAGRLRLGWLRFLFFAGIPRSAAGQVRRNWPRS